MKKVEICLFIPLRDYAAFEDLAEELGCDIEIKEIKAEKPKPSRTRSNFHRATITQELNDEIKRFHENNPQFTQVELGQRFGVSSGSIHRIIHDEWRPPKSTNKIRINRLDDNGNIIK